MHKAFATSKYRRMDHRLLDKEWVLGICYLAKLMWIAFRASSRQLVMVTLVAYDLLNSHSSIAV
jgi:hypothetical protein